MKVVNIASRGQVFYYNPIWGIYGKNKEPKIPYKPNGSLEFKTRPYLVISNNKGNFSSTTCNVVPITTRDEISIPSQVKFVHKGVNQVILTEQVTTCNFKDLGAYCYTVGEDILDKVQKGIYIQFGLKSSNASLEKQLLDKSMKLLAQQLQIAINNMVKIANSQEGVETITEEPIIQTQTSKTPCASSEETIHKSKTSKYSGMSQIEKFNARYKLSVPEKVTESSTNVCKKSRKQWSEEKQKQFAVDSCCMSSEELMEKYEINSRWTLYSYKSRFKKKFSCNGGIRGV